jgi:hypothetical protein
MIWFKEPERVNGSPDLTDDGAAEQVNCVGVVIIPFGTLFTSFYNYFKIDKSRTH